MSYIKEQWPKTALEFLKLPQDKQVEILKKMGYDKKTITNCGFSGKRIAK